MMMMQIMMIRMISFVEDLSEKESVACKGRSLQDDLFNNLPQNSQRKRCVKADFHSVEFSERTEFDTLNCYSHVTFFSNPKQRFHT